MSNLSRHIRQVHNNESTECPDCGKALTISNLNKHIKSVHKKLKKTCDICNEEVPYSSIRYSIQLIQMFIYLTITWISVSTRERFTALESLWMRLPRGDQISS